MSLKYPNKTWIKFSQTSTTTYHLLPWTQVSWTCTIMIKNLQILTRVVLPILYLTPKQTWCQKNPNKHHTEYQCPIVWRIKLPSVHQHQHFHLHTSCEVQCANLKYYQSFCKWDWTSYNKNNRKKHNCSYLANIIYSTKPTTYNQ